MERCYVSYRHFNDFISALDPSMSSELKFRTAADYFIKNGLFYSDPKDNPPFPEAADVVMMNDEDFIKCCDDLSIDLLGSSQSGADETFFNENFECYIIRNLNCLGHDPLVRSHYEIYYVWSGSETVSLNDRSFELKEGDFLFIPPGLEHCTVSSDKAAVSFDILLKERILKNSASGLLSQNNVVSIFFRHSLLSVF